MQCSESLIDATATAQRMLSNVSHLFELLNSCGVRYCHWKSNTALDEALAGQTDIDLLVRREDATTFRALLAQCSFRPAADRDGGSFPSTEHYFGLDRETGTLAHVHAYFRVITGASLTKNHRLPLEVMLLENMCRSGCVPVPSRAAELVVFTVRMMLKHTSLVELLMLARDREGVERETAALFDPHSAEQAVTLAGRWLPALETKLFARCLQALGARTPVMKRILLARRLRWSLRVYARHSRFTAWWTGLRTFTGMLSHRLLHSPNGLVPRTGGAVIAFVGPEATGKSTLIKEVSDWLGAHFAVTRVHAGKPPATIITAIPAAIVPLLRRAAPGHRPSELESCHHPERHEHWVYPFSFAIRSVMLAYERRVLLTRAFARAANGDIVLCDRYPVCAPGSADGPRLMHYSLPRGQYPLRQRLAALEGRLYRQIPNPDLTISLTTPVEIAIARNRTRGKHEPEEYVRRRHLAGSAPVNIGVVHSIDTNRDLRDTLRDVKNAIWNLL